MIPVGYLRFFLPHCGHGKPAQVVGGSCDSFPDFSVGLETASTLNHDTRLTLIFASLVAATIFQLLTISSAVTLRGRSSTIISSFISAHYLETLSIIFEFSIISSSLLSDAFGFICSTLWSSVGTPKLGVALVSFA